MSAANDESSREAATSTVGLESGGCGHAFVLTDEQRRQIRQAAEQAYEKLRWHVGDSRPLLEELQRLSNDSFVEGMRQERSNAIVTGLAPAQEVNHE